MDNYTSLIIAAAVFLCKVFGKKMESCLCRTLILFLSLLMHMHARTSVCISQIVKGPSNQIVSPDDTAVFNCSLSCAQQLPVTWYLTLPTNSRTVVVSPYTSISQVKNIYGIEVARGTVNECSQGGYIVEQLFVKAKQQLNLMPVQCSSVCFGNDCLCGDSSQVHFSKLGVLSVGRCTHACMRTTNVHVHAFIQLTCTRIVLFAFK